MVMKRNKAWSKHKRREIKNSFARYITIFTIVAIGVGFFSGVRISRTAMIQTANTYITEHAMYDFRLLSTLGFTQEDVDAVRNIEGVVHAEGGYTLDILGKHENEVTEVLKVHSLPAYISLPTLLAGEMPSESDECLVDDLNYTKEDIGKTIVVDMPDSDTAKEMLKHNRYRITGLVNSVDYLNVERGNTKLAGGTVSAFVYIPADGFTSEYYTEINVTIQHAGIIFSDEYKNAIEAIQGTLEDVLKERADIRYHNIIDTAKNELKKAEQEYTNGVLELEQKKAEAKAKFEESYKELTSRQSEIDTGKKELNDGITRINNELSGILERISEIENDINNPDYLGNKEVLVFLKSTLEETKYKLDATLSELESKKAALVEAQEKINQSFDEYNKALHEANAQFAEAEQELLNAKEKIQKGKQELADIKEPKTYLLDRSSNIGYVSFENDSAIVEGIAKVFPAFFLLVTALVCMTTMARMVEEHRVQIGTLKALGYSDASIMWKYIFYAGSASLLGSIVGYAVGTVLFPTAVWKAYELLYHFSSKIEYVFSPVLAVLSVGVAMVCSVGVTWLSCKNELMEMPAQLMRQKAPKPGRRVILERIPFLWSRMSFLAKVSARNILRYKKRFFMMIVGIGGCTALVVTALGLRDSIVNVAKDQFGGIFTYDYNINFDTPKTKDEIKTFQEETQDIILQSVFYQSGNVDVLLKSGTKNAFIIATDDQNLTNMINLQHNGETISFPSEGGAVISNKLADLAGVTVGDAIQIRVDEIEIKSLTVSGVFENFVNDYIILSADTYEQVMETQSEYSDALAIAALEDHNAGAAKLLSDYGAINVTVNSEIRSRVDNMMSSLNSVVYLVILSAGALAFVVLFNLSNININERVREIATIKVLGFYPMEVGAYVFRENVVLTLIGTVCGLPFGIWLHWYVMKHVQVDFLALPTRIAPLSFLLAILITFIFTFLVDIVMRTKLERINMAESLKSME